MNKALWRNFTQQEIKQYVKESSSFASLASKLGYCVSSGSYLTTMKSMVAELNLDVSHFTGQSWNKNNFDYDRFRKGKVIKTSQAKDALIFLRGYSCECCGLTEWMDQPIFLEVHHIDGDSFNNELDNLQLLCPNCHSLTENYRGKNINNGIRNVSDDELVNSLRHSPNVYQALKRVGLTAKGGNYKRARELIIKYNIVNLV